MAKNYEYESKNSRNYAGSSNKNSYGDEMNRTDNLRSKNESDCRNKAKNKTSQSYRSEEYEQY